MTEPYRYVQSTQAGDERALSALPTGIDPASPLSGATTRINLKAVPSSSDGTYRGTVNFREVEREAAFREIKELLEE